MTLESNGTPFDSLPTKGDGFPDLIARVNTNDGGSFSVIVRAAGNHAVMTEHAGRKLHVETETNTGTMKETVDGRVITTRFQLRPEDVRTLADIMQASTANAGLENREITRIGDQLATSFRNATQVSRER